jgi:hypothetical protein
MDSSPKVVEAARRPAVWPYVQIARVDHWFKNAFMLLGVVLAVFYQPDVAVANPAASAGISPRAVAPAPCLNELPDGPSDRHPEKRHWPGLPA